MSRTMTEVPNEDEKVYDWRLECLVLAGLEPEVAQILAITDNDLHVMIDVLKRGCTSQLMLEIFS